MRTCASELGECACVRVCVRACVRACVCASVVPGAHLEDPRGPAALYLELREHGAERRNEADHGQGRSLKVRRERPPVQLEDAIPGQTHALLQRWEAEECGSQISRSVHVWTNARQRTQARTHRRKHAHTHTRTHAHTHTHTHTHARTHARTHTSIFMFSLDYLLRFSDISRTLRASVSKQHFVPKTKLNIGKRAFSVDAPTTLNQQNQLTLPKL